MLVIAVGEPVLSMIWPTLNVILYIVASIFLEKEC